jgi:hypothetical protein
MGNKPAGQKIKTAFQDLGRGLEKGFSVLNDKVLRPIGEKLQSAEQTVEKVGDRIGRTGEKILDLVDTTAGNVGKAEDNFNDFLHNLAQPTVLYIALGIGALIVFNSLKKS